MVNPGGFISRLLLLKQEVIYGWGGQQVCGQMGCLETLWVPVEGEGPQSRPASALWGEAGKVLRQQPRGQTDGVKR